jgi:hypothetical protein
LELKKLIGKRLEKYGIIKSFLIFEKNQHFNVKILDLFEILRLYSTFSLYKLAYILDDIFMKNSVIFDSLKFETLHL